MKIKSGLWSSNLKLFALNKVNCKYCTAVTYKFPSKADDYTANPQYPPIEKYDPESQKRKTESIWHDKIKRQFTVEEKLLEVNVPRYYGWKCFMIHEGVIPFNNLKFAGHMTRTHLIETDDLPEYYKKYSDKSLNLLKDIKNDVVDAIEYQLHVRRHELSKILEPIKKEKELTKIIVSEINRVIINSIDEPHLKFVQIDYSPRIEASWKINSLKETYIRKEYKYGIPLDELPEEYLERPSDKYIQYVGRPILQLRYNQPLSELVNFTESDIFSYSVPVYEFDPHISLGYEMERRHITNIPGFWPGDEREFSFLSYHFSNHIEHRPPSYGEVDAKEALQSQALFASFGWLMPLACYKGFSNYHDVTYPMVTQTVLTNGRQFAFAAYQLNTIELHHENPFENTKSNICWMTPSSSLYESYENGKLKGFNEHTLNKLIKFYLNEPQLMSKDKLRPYLGNEIQYAAHYEDDEKAEWLHEKFTKFSSNINNYRPDLIYEVYDWERIFKIMFQMRPRDARKRPFELRENPYHRKMTDSKGFYIPRKFRPDIHLPKWRQRKFKPTFYPE